MVSPTNESSAESNNFENQDFQSFEEEDNNKLEPEKNSNLAPQQNESDNTQNDTQVESNATPTPLVIRLGRQVRWSRRH